MTLETEQRGEGWRKEGSTWIKSVDPKIVAQMPSETKTFIEVAYEKSIPEVLKRGWKKIWHLS